MRYVPALVAERFAHSRIVAFSTACVYPFVDVDGPGAGEAAPLTPPPGEYANSCVARERMFQHFSHRFGTPGRLIRLSYAIDMRYGVLHDIARKLLAREPIDLAMGHANVIWQGDANDWALRALAHCTAPTTRPQRQRAGGERSAIVALGLAQRLGVAPVLTGQRGAHRLAGRHPRGAAPVRAARGADVDACSTGLPTGCRATWRAWASRPTTKRATASTEKPSGPPPSLRPIARHPALASRKTTCTGPTCPPTRSPCCGAAR